MPVGIPSFFEFTRSCWRANTIKKMCKLFVNFFQVRKLTSFIHSLQSFDRLCTAALMPCVIFYERLKLSETSSTALEIAEEEWPGKS